MFSMCVVGDAFWRSCPEEVPFGLNFEGMDFLQAERSRRGFQKEIITKTKAQR